MTHTRPSHVLKVTDEFAAYQFDLAVLTFGRHVESEIQNGKQLTDLLSVRKGYRTLAGQATQKVKMLPWET